MSLSLPIFLDYLIKKSLTLYKMSQIPTENDNNRSVAASDFLQLDQPDEMPDQEEREQQHERPQFGFQQNPLDWTMNTGRSNNYGNSLKELKLMMTNLESTVVILQGKLENLELKAENRALKVNAEQKANYQDLEARIMGKLTDEFAKMLSTQNEQHQKEMAQLEAKNRKLEEKLSRVELQIKGTTDQNGEIVENGQKAIGSNQLKLDYLWGHLLTKSKILANPKGYGWNGLKTTASISEYGLKATSGEMYKHYIFATEGYTISGEHCRKDNFPFPGTIVFYYEVTKTSGWLESVGFSDGNEAFYKSANSYAIARRENNNHDYNYWLSGKAWGFEDSIRYPPAGTVFGCGLLLNSKNELAVFFTVNGILRVKQTQITPTVDRLYPTVSICSETSVEANFGDKHFAKPFKFDTDKCPGLVIE